LSKSFKTNADAKRWGIETELKIRREDVGIAKISYPTFSDIGLRYITDVSIEDLIPKLKLSTPACLP
jgi:hypothetical protein